MNKFKVAIIFALTIAIMTICACGANSNNNIQTNNTANTDYIDVVKQFIEGKDTSTNELINSELRINSLDKVDNPEIKQSYQSESAYFVQINNRYMYRFQISNGIITNYIKYNIRG